MQWDLNFNWQTSAITTGLPTLPGIGVLKDHVFFIQNCSVPPPPPSGYPAGGWVGQPKSREGQFKPPPPPVSLSKGLVWSTKAAIIVRVLESGQL